MKELNTPPKSNHARFSPSLLSGLSNSSHFKAIREFLVAARRGEARQLLITTLVSLTLVLPAAALILSNGLQIAGSNLKQARLISVFMTSDTEHALIEDLASMLATNDHIDATRLVKLKIPESPDSQTSMLEVIPAGDLKPEAVIALADNLSVLAGIDFVELNRPRLIENQSAFNLLTGVAKLANLVALLIAAALVWVVSRHDILSNTPTIKLLRQLGGTQQDIQRPFLYRSPAVCLVAGGLGICVAMLILWIFKNNIDLSTYNSLIAVKPTSIQVLSFVFVVITVSLLATLRLFSNIFTHYNQ